MNYYVWITGIEESVYNLFISNGTFGILQDGLMTGIQISKLDKE